MTLELDESNLYCPYCGKDQLCDNDEISALMVHKTCESCGKEFWYSVDVTREYQSHKPDVGEDMYIRNQKRARNN
jgi:transposase-like protein